MSEIHDVRNDVHAFTASLVLDLDAQLRSPLLNRCRSRYRRSNNFNSVGSQCFGDTSPIMYTRKEFAT